MMEDKSPDLVGIGIVLRKNQHWLDIIRCSRQESEADIFTYLFSLCLNMYRSGTRPYRGLLRNVTFKLGTSRKKDFN